MALTLLDPTDLALTPGAAGRELAGVLEQLRILHTHFHACVSGLDREAALELALVVEDTARLVSAVQLQIARAVDEAAPVPVGGLVLVDHHGDLTPTPAVGDERGCQPSTASPSPYRRASDLLAVRLRISRREAARRVRLARKVLPRHTLTGQVLPAEHPHVAEQLPHLDTAAIGHILRATDRTQRIAGPDPAGEVETYLTTQALIHDPDTIARLADHVIAVVDPDGVEPHEDPNWRTGLTIGRTHDGLTPIRMILDQIQLETLLTVLTTATNPRTTSAQDPNTGSNETGSTETGHGQTGETQVDGAQDGLVGNPFVVETRSREQLHLDAVIAALAAALRTGTLPQSGGLPTQIMITMPLTSLTRPLQNRHHGTSPTNNSNSSNSTDSTDSSHGSRPPTSPPPGTAPPPWLKDTPTLPHTGPIPIHLVRRLACDADLIPIVLGTGRRILDLGRTHRLYPTWLRQAMIARDGGCLFPGCPIPATWCEAHHLTDWAHGGTTTLDDSALLCPAHHHAIHTGHWTITPTPTGQPTITPPWTTTPGLTTNPYHHGH